MLRRAVFPLAAIVIALLHFSCGSSESIESVTPKGLDFFFCNYWEDQNQDGVIQPKEWVGIKDTFRVSERLEFVGEITGKKGAKVQFKLLDPERVVVKADEQVAGEDTYLGRYSFEPYDLFKKGGAGRYSVEWYVNGNLIRRLDLTLLN
jgi:hypothetical protein